MRGAFGMTARREKLPRPTPLGPPILWLETNSTSAPVAAKQQAIRTEGLHRVADHDPAGIMDQRCGLGDRLDHAGFVVGRLERQHGPRCGIFGQAGAQIVKVQPALRIETNGRRIGGRERMSALHRDVFARPDEQALAGAGPQGGRGGFGRAGDMAASTWHRWSCWRCCGACGCVAWAHPWPT